MQATLPPPTTTTLRVPLRTGLGLRIFGVVMLALLFLPVAALVSDAANHGSPLAWVAPLLAAAAVLATMAVVVLGGGEVVVEPTRIGQRLLWRTKWCAFDDVVLVNHQRGPGAEEYLSLWYAIPLLDRAGTRGGARLSAGLTPGEHSLLERVKADVGSRGLRLSRLTIHLRDGRSGFHLRGLRTVDRARLLEALEDRLGPELGPLDLTTERPRASLATEFPVPMRVFLAAIVAFFAGLMFTIHLQQRLWGGMQPSGPPRVLGLMTAVVGGFAASASVSWGLRRCLPARSTMQLVVRLVVPMLAIGLLEGALLAPDQHDGATPAGQVAGASGSPVAAPAPPDTVTPTPVGPPVIPLQPPLTVTVGADAGPVLTTGPDVWITSHGAPTTGDGASSFSVPGSESPPGRVSRVDAATGTVIQSVDGLRNPVAMAFDGAHLWVGEAGSPSGEPAPATVAEVDPATGSVLRRFDAGVAFLKSVAFIDGGLWISGDGLVRLDPATGALRRVRITSGTGIRQVDVSYGQLTVSGDALWVGASGAVARVDTSRFRIVPKDTAVELVNQIGWDGTHLWTNETSTDPNTGAERSVLVRRNPRTGRPDRRLGLPGSPIGLTFHQGTVTVAVRAPSYVESLVLVDPGSVAPTGTVSADAMTPGASDTLRIGGIGSSGLMLWVSNADRLLGVLLPQGR